MLLSVPCILKARIEMLLLAKLSESLTSILQSDITSHSIRSPMKLLLRPFISNSTNAASELKLTELYSAKLLPSVSDEFGYRR